ncbi:hypothetical protein HDU91_005029 [Kappamyces sp. JEL0680]|nr:hypothetical protein HDU91_005029 [Kappamyces sp. JEL0680]
MISDSSPEPAKPAKKTLELPLGGSLPIESSAFQEAESLLEASTAAYETPGETTSFFAERDKFMSILTGLLDGTLQLNASDFYRFVAIIDRYQENPQLLDPHLESIIHPIINKCLGVILKFDLSQTHAVSVKFFSHEVSHLEPCIDFFNHISDPAKAAFRPLWEMRFVMLLWISLVCMIPFDLKKIDSERAGQDKLVDRILGIVKLWIDCVGTAARLTVGKEYEGAGLLAMRLLTRRDVCVDHLIPFVDWQVAQIKNATNAFQLRGNLKCLAGLYKYGPREVLMPTIHQAVPCLELITARQFQTNSLLRKLHIKLSQRLALCSLKNLLDSADTAAPSKPPPQPLDADEDEDEDDEVSEEIEQVIGILMEHLRDRDTIVRWMAAKGIGRICNRLNFDMADQVVASVIEMLQEDVEVPEGQPIQQADISLASDHTWHGACLALAELTRRGLLLPDRLAEAVPWVLRALTFEQRKGTYALGSNVRDAACYMFWSVARAYESHVVAPFAQNLATSLVVVSLTDREVSIRRAASAAFQENAGRHGLFPHGIDVVTTADYFAIGNKTNCFLDIALKIASFEEYREAIVDHILNTTKNASVQITPAQRQEMVGFVVLACFEKIDRIRETAGYVLHEILADKDIFIPDRKHIELATGLPSKELNWLNSGEAFPVVANCIYIPYLCNLVMTGLMINIGGLTESLVRHATDCFTGLVGALPSSLCPELDAVTPQTIVDSISQVFLANVGNERITIPLMETLDIYLSMGYLVSITDASPVKSIFNSLKKEVFKSKNTKKLLVGTKVFSGFAALTDQDQPDEFRSIQKLALEKLVLYLGHPYPIIRTSCSEALYMLASTSLDTVVDPNDLMVAEETLLSTKWDASLEECKSPRDTSEDSSLVLPTNMSAPRIVLTEVEKTIQTILTNFTNHLGQKNPGVPSPQLRIAGGWVRDKLLGKESHDIDIAIDNMKGEPFAQELKAYLVQIGMNMSSISKIQLNPDKSKHLETATARLFDLDVDFVNLRSETYNDDSRHPEMVGCWLSYIEEFGTPLQDALRRDITINTLFYNLHTEAVEDYTGHGLDDLKNRIIRTPLPPLQTFLDDPLRILRVIRFASRFDYSLYPDIVEATKDATLRTAFEKKISRERVGVEVEKMLLGPNPQRAVSLISEFGFYDLVFACPDGIVPDSVPAERSSASIKYSTILKLCDSLCSDD